jgi:predicted RNA binding protein YcfA (HicA-like mRNA interferase family)
MPPKIRELIRDLESAGFRNQGGKGSHRKFRHPNGMGITVSGNTGDDAKLYQIKGVRSLIAQVSNEKK